jgi:hypothetical protein
MSDLRKVWEAYEECLLAWSEWDDKKQTHDQTSVDQLVSNFQRLLKNANELLLAFQKSHPDVSEQFKLADHAYLDAWKKRDQCMKVLTKDYATDFYPRLDEIRNRPLSTDAELVKYMDDQRVLNDDIAPFKAAWDQVEIQARQLSDQMRMLEQHKNELREPTQRLLLLNELCATANRLSFEF